MNKRHTAGLAFRHLTAMLAAVLTMACGTYLFNLMPETLYTIGSASAKLTHIKLFAICVIVLGMGLFLCSFLDLYEKKVNREKEQNTAYDSI